LAVFSGNKTGLIDHPTGQLGKSEALRESGAGRQKERQSDNHNRQRSPSDADEVQLTDLDSSHARSAVKI
jgi:hypothetical protein